MASPYQNRRTLLVPAALIFSLIIIASENFILFHTIAELFTVGIAVLIFVVAWHAYPFSRNNFLMFLGIGYFWVGMLDLYHTLVFPGLSIYEDLTGTPTAQIWVFARLLEALTLLIAPLFLTRDLKPARPFVIFGVISAIAYQLVISGNFPAAFYTDTGLTDFKIYSEYVIIALLFAACFHLWIKRHLLNPRLLILLIIAIGLTIISEVTFTLYAAVDDIYNMSGHIVKILSFWLIFDSLVKSALTRPYRELKKAHDDMEHTVVTRTKKLEQEVEKHKNTELALIESKARLTQLLTSSPVVIHTRKLRDGYPVTFISDNAREIFGYSPEELMHDPELWNDLIHPDDKTHALEELNNILSSRSLTQEYRIKAHDGGYKWVYEELKIINDDHNEPLSIIGCRYDITERKNTEAELIAAKIEADRANQTKSQFLSKMSHELRTPLNAIMGFSQLSEYDETLSDSQRNVAQKIYSAGQHLLILINEILDLAKIESGNVSLLMQPISTTEVINDCLALTETLSSSRNISIEFKPENDNEDIIIADYLRFKQVLLNLLSNAIKYNKTGGQVEIYCSERKADTVRVNVSDTGAGIDMHKILHLYEPFNRLGAEASNIEGTGIGLIITRQLVELMGGELGVESTPGKGTVFWVNMKRSSSARFLNKDKKIRAQINDITEPVTRAARILVVEDNELNLEVLKLQMQSLGYNAFFSSDGQEALEELQSNIYDIILTDIKMPKIDGYELAHAIRHNNDSINQHTTIIAISANSMQSDIEQCMNAGMNDFIAKPVNIEQLNQTLKKWLPLWLQITPA
ncbi:MAG: MASE3 domain-containing protein [Gammaproteobacteria bacterium]|nr:MASE3 domain-containing protein [Gammaproteobacteria bacterium]